MNGTHYDYQWFGYIYSNEWLDEVLNSAMPIYLQQYYFDCLIMWKKVIENGEEKFFKMPRIFRNCVHIAENTMMPEHHENIKFEIALDGWILENDR